MNNCRDCHFWHADPTPDYPSQGDCWLFSDDASLDGSRPAIERAPDKLALICPFAGADGATLITDAAFGCVQWEPR